MPQDFSQGTDLATAGSAALGAPAMPQVPVANPAQLIQGLQGLTTTGSQLPQYRPQPQYQQQQPVVPQGSFQTKGEAKRANKQALFTNLGNLVKSFTGYEQQKKERHIQMLSERLFGAMAGMQEAQASGNKEAIQANSQIINDILSDKKNRKLFEKAFDINFFGEDKHKDTPERKGVQKGLTASWVAMQKMQNDFKSGQNPLNAYGQKMMQQFPQREGLDPKAQLLAQLTKSGVLPSANAQLQQQTQLAVADLRSQDAAVRAKGLTDAATIRANATTQAAKMRVDAEMGKLLKQEEMLKYRVTSQMIMQQKKLDQTADMFKQTMGLKDKLGQTMMNDKNFQEVSKQATALDTRIKTLQTQKAQLDKNIASIDAKGAWNKGINSSELQDWRQQSMDLQITLQNLGTDAAGLQQKMQTLQQMNQMMIQSGMSSGGGDADITVTQEELDGDN